MRIKVRQYNTLVMQSKIRVVGFKEAYSKFIGSVSIDQKSASLMCNSGTSVASIALHFGRTPQEISVDEINSDPYF